MTRYITVVDAQAVRKAREVLDAKGSNCTKETIQQIANFEVLQSVLHDLDVAHLPPQTSKAYRQLPALNQRSVGLAIDSLKDLNVILRALHTAALQSTALQAVMDECLALLLLQWGDITIWIIFLIRRGSPSNFEWTNVLLYSIDILEVTVGRLEEDQYRQQFISLPSTIDILLLLLSLTDSRTRKPITLPSSFSDTCSIAHLLGSYTKGADRQQNINSRLLSLGRKQSRRFTSSLLSRVQDLATPENMRDPSVAAETLFNLFGGVAGLLFTNNLKRDFERIHFIVEIARAMRTVIEKGVALKLQDNMYWRHMTECIFFIVTFVTSHQGPRLSYQAILGGLLPCLFHALPLAKYPSLPNGLQHEALRILYYLTDSRAFRAAKDAGSMETLESCMQGTSESQRERAKYVYDAYSTAFRGASLAFDRRRTVTACCSLKVRSFRRPKT